MVERVRGLWPQVRERCVLRLRRGIYSYELVTSYETVDLNLSAHAELKWKEANFLGLADDKEENFEDAQSLTEKVFKAIRDPGAPQDDE
eukprot:4363430-Prymnesium_polylepis.2